MKKAKTMYELCREFPNKTYRELEKYRDADRQEEAKRIALSESQKSQDKLEPIAEGVCIIGEARKDREEINWKEKYKKEHKLRQEAEGETSLVKAVGQNSPEMKGLESEVEALKQQLHIDREKYRKENNDLYNRIADALAVNEDHQKMNGKLQERLTELEEENKKMHDALNKRMNNIRKSGL